MTLPLSLRDEGYTAEFEMQGNRTRVKVTRPYLGEQPNRGKEPRGTITHFSRRSRKRLLDYAASIEWQGQKAVFLTLTYPKQFPSAAQAKKHLRAFLERIRRRYPKASAIWRLEFQKRGAPHFHLLFFKLPYVDKKVIQEWWGEIIGYASPFTRIELIKSWRHAMSYVSKYIAKMPDAAEGGFNYLPYLHAVGRFWGFFNREEIPFAAKMVISLGQIDRVFYQFRRYCKKGYWKGIKMQGFPTGWTIYHDNPLYLLDVLKLSEALPCT